MDGKSQLDSFSPQCALYVQSWLQLEPRPEYRMYVLTLTFEVEKRRVMQVPRYLYTQSQGHRCRLFILENLLTFLK